tara:strand:- start:1238 stop:1444 length:207 start_codon:yes stop_codon:yes gene_type:complete
MSKKYRVGVAYEEGFVVNVKANSKEQASKKVYDKVDMFGDCIISDTPKFHDKKTVHREWFITDVEENR